MINVAVAAPFGDSIRSLEERKSCPTVEAGFKARLSMPAPIIKQGLLLALIKFTSFSVYGLQALLSAANDVTLDANTYNIEATIIFEIWHIPRPPKHSSAYIKGNVFYYLAILPHNLSHNFPPEALHMHIQASFGPSFLVAQFIQVSLSIPMVSDKQSHLSLSWEFAL